jgi:hypothetical protein
MRRVEQHESNEKHTARDGSQLEGCACRLASPVRDESCNYPREFATDDEPEQTCELFHIDSLARTR